MEGMKQFTTEVFETASKYAIDAKQGPRRLKASKRQ